MEYIIIAVLVFIIGVLVCREIVCWYFKIGEIVSVLREISIKLDQEHLKRWDVEGLPPVRE